MHLLEYIKKNYPSQSKFAQDIGMTRQMLHDRIKGKVEWKAKEVERVQNKTKFQVEHLSELLVDSAAPRKKD